MKHRLSNNRLLTIDVFLANEEYEETASGTQETESTNFDITIYYKQVAVPWEEEKESTSKENGVGIREGEEISKFLPRKP